MYIIYLTFKKFNPINFNPLNYEKFAIRIYCYSVTYEYLCALISNPENEQITDSRNCCFRRY